MTGVLNFMIAGEIRSGLTLVQSAIANRGAACHENLLHDDDALRRQAHEDYFGNCADPDGFPEWLGGNEISPWQYLVHTVFDNPIYGEPAIGVLARYGSLRRWDLFDLVEQRWREGDFCLIHVIRNPAACFVSLKQAEKTGVWSLSTDQPLNSVPQPVRLDPEELTAFCRDHLATRLKVQRACEDTFAVHYADLIADYRTIMAKIFYFLEFPPTPAPPRTSYRRLANKTMRQRVFAFDELVAKVPPDIREMLTAEDFR